jgi:hypothetical protein
MEICNCKRFINFDLFFRQTAAAIPTAGDQKSTCVAVWNLDLLRLFTEAAINIEKVTGALSRNSLQSFAIEKSNSLSFVGLLRQLGNFFEQRAEHSLSISFIKINNSSLFSDKFFQAAWAICL